MESHLLQMRGLKQHAFGCLKVQTESHLLQMRGLKHPLSYSCADRPGRIFYRCVD